ncbi:hypothetical protein [Rhodopirellula europaea]|uniref:hypothetical protein n=1 Tax=Rhodopirellula europaea TaxID=1263866 RepID=UPI003D29190E
MTGLIAEISQLKQQMAAEKEQTRWSLVEIAEREIKGKSRKDDAKNLMAALEALNLESSYYEGLAFAMRSLGSIEAEVKVLDERAAEQATRKAEFEETQARCHAEVEEARLRWHNCDVSNNLAQIARDKGSIIQRFPFLFDDPSRGSRAKPKVMGEPCEAKAEELRRANQQMLDASILAVKKAAKTKVQADAATTRARFNHAHAQPDIAHYQPVPAHD